MCSSYPRNQHKRDRLIKGKNALGQRQLCRDRQKCSTYPRYRDNEVRLYVINMDKSKGCKLKLVPNNKRKCDAIYKYLFLDITMVISNPIRIRVNPTVTPAAIPIKNKTDCSQLLYYLIIKSHLVIPLDPTALICTNQFRSLGLLILYIYKKK